MGGLNLAVGISKRLEVIFLFFVFGLFWFGAGCSSAQGFSTRPSPSTPDGLTAPPSTIEQLSECANRETSQFTDTNYAIMFDLEAAESGNVLRAKVTDSMLGDSEMESCMAGVLEGMVLPSVTRAMRSRKLGSNGNVSLQSLAPMGNVLVLGGPINLVPILIVAGGVTILVAVAIYVVSDSTASSGDPKPAGPDCKKEKERCLDVCSDSSLPSGDHGFRFWNCVNKCMADAGC